MRRTSPHEDAEQIAVFKLAALHLWRWPVLDYLYHVPNGGLRSKATAGRFKAMGVKAGVPDICLDQPRGGYTGLRIELKRRDGKPSDLSYSQRKWIAHLEKMGHMVKVAYGADDAWEIIQAYLSLPE